MKAILLVLFAVVSVFGFASAAPDKVVCYWGTWSVYRNGNGHFDAGNIDPFVCTHLIYAFVGINSDGSVRVLDNWNDVENKGFEKFNALKLKNRSLKTLVAIGGWNEGSLVFSQVASSQRLRNNFVQNAKNFVKKHGFDGFDLDWEYPGQRGGSQQDKANFALLLQEFRRVFDQEKLLLTAAVAAAAPSVDISYDVPSVSKYLDFINVMTYDLHGPWDGVTGQNAPLYPSPNDVTASAKELNVAACIKTWISRGAAPEKLVLGIGVYGRSFTLSSSSNNGIGAPSNAPGNIGQYTQESGMLGYNEICELILVNKWKVVWDDIQKVPYAYSGNQWVGYDNTKSVDIKIQFAKDQQLGGAMIWSIETDDFRGTCGSRYPILGAINYGLFGTAPPVPEPDPEPSPEEPTAAPPSSSTTAPNPNPSNGCVKEGHYRDPDNCSVFYYCLPNGAGGFIRYPNRCPAGLVFNLEKDYCDYPSNVKC